MTDKELLELAAKAAGIDLTFEIDGVTTCHWENDIESLGEWNPLTDDGAALRLAVSLCLIPYIPVFCHQKAICQNEDASIFVEEEVQTNDPYAATRRAIVRAASEIGKAMK